MLKKIRSFTDQHAIPAAVIAFVILKLLIMGLGQLLSLLPATLPAGYLNEIVLMLVPAAIVCFFGFSRAFKKGNFLRGLLCGLPFIVLELFLLFVFFGNTMTNPEADWRSWDLIILGLVSIFGVGFREECLYRATIQNIVAKKHANSVKGIWITVIVSALIFGLTHITNIFFGMDPIAVLMQVLSAMLLGLLFGAVYLRSGSLWAVVLIHTLTDIAGLASSTFLRVTEIEDLNRLADKVSLSWIQIGNWLFYIGLTAFLLRPSKCKQICESLCFANKETKTEPNSQSESQASEL